MSFASGLAFDEALGGTYVGCDFGIHDVVKGQKGIQ